MQERLPQFEANGATLVALSPEHPDNTLTLVEKQNLQFPVLSDTGLVVARQFGIAYELPPDLDSLYRAFGNDLRAHNHSDKAELPIPATYVVDTTGTIRFAHLDVDYTYRAEPSEILKVLREL